MINTKLWLVKRQLGSKLPQRRLKAVQSLRGGNDPEAVAMLISALEDPEAAVRSEVVIALGDYDVAVEFENNEVWREHIKLTGTVGRFRQDIGLEFRGGVPAGNPGPDTSFHPDQ